MKIEDIFPGIKNVTPRKPVPPELQKGFDMAIKAVVDLLEKERLYALANRVRNMKLVSNK